jgi:hypothetical protein
MHTYNTVTYHMYTHTHTYMGYTSTKFNLRAYQVGVALAEIFGYHIKI